MAEQAPIPSEGEALPTDFASAREIESERGFVGRIENFGAILLTLGVVFEACDLYRVVGIVVYGEQFLAAIMAIAHPLVFLRYTVGRRLRTGKVPWYDLVAAALVCAARSCPPLRREAYTGDEVEGQLDDNTRRWLADTALNQFGAGGRAEVSPIFKWYREDFERYPGGLAGFLRKYAPVAVAEGVQGSLDIRFNDYDWGLNDQSDTGAGYSTLDLVIDWIKGWFR